MNYGDTQDAFDRFMTASGSLEKLIADLRIQAREAQAAIRTTREQEEARLEQAMVAMFRNHQQQMEAALRPSMARAWQIVAAATGVFALLFCGWLALMKQAEDRLRAVQVRTEAAEVSAQVLEAMRHVEMTSCGGRPCIRIDKNTPTWRRGKSEYVLVDGHQAIDERR
jgi:hypothetical protein